MAFNFKDTQKNNYFIIRMANCKNVYKINYQ